MTMIQSAYRHDSNSYTNSIVPNGFRLSLKLLQDADNEP